MQIFFTMIYIGVIIGSIILLKVIRQLSKKDKEIIEASGK